MQLRESAYQSLLVSSSDKFNTAFSGMLPEGRYETPVTASAVSTARQILLERSFDFIVINTPLPDEFGTRFAIDICRSSSAGILMFVKAEHYEEVYDKVTDLGVLLLQKPTSSQAVIQSLHLLTATRERMRRLERTADSLKEKMEEIRLVNRAKWLLIEQLKMTEPDAHRYIEKTAMDRCVTKRSVAESIIQIYQ